MPGLSSALLKKLRESLLDCGPFGSDRALASVFVDERIAPWKNQVSEADSRRERVDLFVSDFLNRRSRAGQSVLVLFLQAVHDQADAQDECHQRLDDLAIEVAAALGAELPPLARSNLWRASAARADGAPPAEVGGYELPAAETEPGAQTAPLPPGLSPEILAEKLESLKSKEKADWLPVSFLEQGLQAARAVGRVEHQGSQVGTAFLVAPDLVLTNAHVVGQLPDLRQSGARFSVGLRDEPQWRYFAEQVQSSPIDQLDFTLLRLSEPLHGAPPVALSAETAYADQPANILQFPSGVGGLMQVALRYNAIVYVEPRRLYYVTDTRGGSSGSPVFDDGWRVIALHRGGVADGGRRGVKDANHGVPIAAIAPLIRAHLG